MFGGRGMDGPQRFAVSVLVVCLVALCAAWAAAEDVRHASYGRARLLDVESPNVLVLRMADRNETVTVRLLGVGSPRNKDRLKDLGPEGPRFVANHHLWDVSRAYVKSLLDGRVAEVRVRRWNKFDEKRRLLAYVLIPNFASEPVDVNAEIIRNGMGFVTRDYVHVTFADYKRLEEDARTHRRGLWGCLVGSRVSRLER
jgi:endonuclease YncB( thermonuclease family)